MKKVIENIETVIVGKPQVIRQALITLLCRGHLLIEDVPGVGKTILARALSTSINADFKRIQFTPDLLPSDVTGANVFDQKKSEFYFYKGPVFTNTLLADEINRGTPRTQSSLLECMEERQVSMDGKTHVLPELFFVIATQNPLELHGTYPLPEAQLDRFFMKIDVGYPDQDNEMKIIKNQQIVHPVKTIKPVVELREILDSQEKVAKIHIDESLLRYITDIIIATRNHEETQLGASPRGSQALCRAAQAVAFLDGMDFVKPDHIKSIVFPVLRHRLILKPQARLTGIQPDAILKEILEEISVPVS